MNLLNSKKGGGGIFGSYMVIPIFLFILGVSGIMGYFIWTEMVDAFDTAGIYHGAAKETGDKFTSAMGLMDSIVVVIMVALIIGIGITSYRLKVPTIYFIVMLMMGIFLGIVSYFFNYIFAQIVYQTEFDAVRVYFVKTIWVCTNLHWVSLVAIVVGSILTYSKKVDSNEAFTGL